MTQTDARIGIREFAGYALLGEAGRGGSGVVYFARHLRLNRRAAVKILNSRWEAHSEARRRFFQEAEVMARLDHPNVAAVFEAGEYQGCPFIASRWVDGSNLVVRLAEDQHRAASAGGRAGGLREVRQAVLLIRQVAAGVRHAHEHGVLHCDLKPANILIDESGVPHVTDFGTAHLIVEGAAPLAPAGSVGYMAPERASGAQGPTVATDIFGLGVLLYNVLSGRLPWKGRTIEEVLGTQRAGPPPSLDRYNPKVDLDLAAICLKCLEFNPDNRYASAALLEADLDRWLRGEPTLVRPPSRRVRLVKWVRRNRTASLLGLLLVLAIGTGLGASLVGWFRARHFQSLHRDSMADRDQVMLGARLRWADALLDENRTRDGIEALVSLVREYPASAIAQTRLWTALNENHVAWPGLAPFVHDSSVLATEFIAPHKLLATLSADNYVHVWCCTSGVRRLKFPHDASRGRFALAPDGLDIATLAPDGRAQIWQLPAGRPRLVIGPSARAEDAGMIDRVAFDPTGTRLATGRHDGRVQLWSRADGQPGPVFTHGEPVRFLSFSRSGTLILAAGTTRVSIWDLDPKDERDPAVPDEGPRKCVELTLPEPPMAGQVSPDGTRFLVGYQSKVVVYDARTGRDVLTFPFNARVTAAIYTADGRYLICGNDSDRTHLFHAKAGERVRTALRSPDAVTAVAFCSDPRLLAIGSVDGTAQVWSIPSWGKLAIPARHEAAVLDVALAPDGRHLATASADRTARLWTLSLPLASETKMPGRSAMLRRAWSPDGAHVVCVTTNHSVAIRQPWGDTVLRDRIPHETSVTALDYSPDGASIATAEAAGLVWVASTRTNAPPRCLDRQPEPPTALRWSPDGRCLAVARSSSVSILRPGTEASTTRLSFPAATFLEFSPDSTHLAIAAASGPVEIRRSPTADSVARLETGPVRALRYSPDGHWLAVIERDAAVKVWNTRTWTASDPPIVTPSPATQIAFSPDGHALLTASTVGEVDLWETATCRHRARLGSFQSEARSAGFSPDGQWVLVASASGYVRLLHVPDGLDAMRPLSLPGLLDAQFTPNGRFLLLNSTGSLMRANSGPASVPPLPDLLALAQFVLGRRLNPDGSWSALTTEQHLALRNTIAARWSHAGPKPQVLVVH